MHVCSQGHAWTGNRCHCATCHTTFSSISTFDAHVAKKSGTRDDHDRTCPDPAAIGLVQRDSRAGTYWGYPRDDRFTERINNLRSNA